MSSRRRKPKNSSDLQGAAPNGLASNHRSGSLRFWPAIIGIPLFLGIWLAIWLTQTLYVSSQPEQSHPRWHLIFSLFFLPDEIFSAWTDGRVSWHGIFDRLRVLMIAALVTLPGWLAGGQLLRSSGLGRRLARLEIAMLGLAAGLSLHATATLLLGLAGWVSYHAAMPLLGCLEIAVAIALGWRFPWFDPRQSGRRALRHFIDRPTATLFVSLAILLVAARCLMPSNEFDVLEYHQGAPKEWFQAGQIGFSAHNIYANMPMAAEMQSLAAMSWAGALGLTDAWWWGGLAGKSMIFLYWGLTIGLTACLVRRFVGRDAACWMIVVGCSGLALAEVTVLGLIEPAAACYFAAALLVLAAHRQQLVRHRAAMFWIGLMAGSSLACKYPALVFVCFPIGLIAAWQSMRQQPQLTRVLGGLGLLVLGSLITAGPWLVKNAVLARNPVYPLAAGYMGGYKFSEHKMQQWQAAHAVPTRSLSALGDSLVQIAWAWKPQGALLIPLALLGLLQFRRSPIVRLALVIILYSLAVWWLATHHLERFLLPTIPIVLLLAGFGIDLMFRKLGRQLAVSCLSLGVSCNLILLAVSPTLGDPRLLVDPSQLRREGIAASDSPRVPKHVLWANTNLGQSGDLLLLVGDAAIFNYEVPILYSTCFDTSELTQIASRPASQWKEAFGRRGITHVLVHWGEIARYRSTGNYGFDAQIDQPLLQRMVDQGVLVPIETEIDPQYVAIYAVKR